MFSAGDSPAPANVESAIEHIAVAQRIDLLLVAPATADILGKFANGIAEDFLATLYLATKAARRRRSCHERQHVGAPRDATQPRDSARTRRSRGGSRRRLPRLRNGRRGPPRRHRDHRQRKFAKCSACATILPVKQFLVTAGPTCEDIDPCSISHQSLIRENGLRSRGSCESPRRSRRSGQRTHRFENSRRRGLGSGSRDRGNASGCSRTRRKCERRDYGRSGFGLSSGCAARSETKAQRGTAYARPGTHAGYSRRARTREAAGPRVGRICCGNKCRRRKMRAEN